MLASRFKHRLMRRSLAGALAILVLSPAIAAADTACRDETYTDTAVTGPFSEQVTTTVVEPIYGFAAEASPLLVPVSLEWNGTYSSAWTGNYLHYFARADKHLNTYKSAKGVDLASKIGLVPPVLCTSRQVLGTDANGQARYWQRRLSAASTDARWVTDPEKTDSPSINELYKAGDYPKCDEDGSYTLAGVTYFYVDGSHKTHLTGELGAQVIVNTNPEYGVKQFSETKNYEWWGVTGYVSRTVELGTRTWYGTEAVTRTRTVCIRPT